MDDEGVKFAKSTPMEYILDNDFVLCINKKHFVQVLNYFNNEEGLISIDQSITLGKNKHYKVCQELGLNDRET